MPIVEGLIGCGKSELLKQLATKGWLTVPEPVEHWTKLSEFYREPINHAFALQLQVISSFPRSSKYTVQERSARSAIEVFGRMLLDKTLLTPPQFSTLSCAYALLNFEENDCIVFLDVPPEVCLERIASRQRACEENITLDYLKSLREYYMLHLDDLRSQGKHVRVLNCLGKTPDEIALLFGNCVSALS